MSNAGVISAGTAGSQATPSRSTDHGFSAAAAAAILLVLPLLGAKAEKMAAFRRYRSRALPIGQAVCDNECKLRPGGRARIFLTMTDNTVKRCMVAMLLLAAAKGKPLPE
jgi:hypothetical protein